MISPPVVLLAAGRGGRIAADGPPTPKCLLEIAGRPLIAWIADALASVGVRQGWVVTGFQAELLDEAVASLPLALQLQTTRCVDWELGNGRSAAHAESVVPVGQPFLLMMGDHLVSADHLRPLIANADGYPTSCLLGVCDPGAPTIDLEDATKVWVDDRGFVEEIGKETSRFNGIDTGSFLMRPAIFSALADASASGDHSLSGGNRVLIAQRQLKAVHVNSAGWQDVDTPADLLAARRLVSTLKP